jgi:methylglyoxal synthase
MTWGISPAQPRLARRASARDTVPMVFKTITMPARKRIALVAHDARKADLAAWAKVNRATLQQHELWATGTTGTLLETQLGLTIQKLFSGPLGGDQQVGAMIVEGRIDFLLFFWDPLEAQPHDPDVKALLRMASVWNVPTACDEATADFLITSPLMNSSYERRVPDYEAYRAARASALR